MSLYGCPDLVLGLLQVDVDPLRLGAVKVRVHEELDAVALRVPAMQWYFRISGFFKVTSYRMSHVLVDWVGLT